MKKLLIPSIFLYKSLICFSQEKHEQCHSQFIGTEEPNYKIELTSTEIPLSGSSFDIEFNLISLKDQTWKETVSLSGPVSNSELQSIQNVSTAARLSGEVSIAQNETFAFRYRVNFDAANLPYYHQEIRVLISSNDSTKEALEDFVYVYFTPYNTIEIFNETDFIKSGRGWLPYSQNHTPKRIIPKDSIPVTNLTAADSLIPDNEIRRVFLNGLGYAITMKVPAGTVDPGNDMLLGNWWGEETFRFYIENCRFFTWTKNDAGNDIKLPVSFAKVKVFRARDVAWDDPLGTFFTDKDGYMISGSGNRKIDFTYTSWNARIRIYLELELESSDGKLNVRLDDQWTTSDMVTSEVSIAYYEQNVNLGFGETQVGQHEGGRQYAWANNAWREVEYATGRIIDHTLEVVLKDCNQCSSNFKWISGISPTIYISKPRRNSERTLWHEFGHFVMRWLQDGVDQPNSDGTHAYHVNNSSPQLTLTEGFANGFAFIMDEILFWMDGEAGTFENGWSNHDVYAPLTSSITSMVHHPNISELIFGVTLLDLWDGPSNYNLYNYPVSSIPNIATRYNDGGADNFEISLNEILKPIYDWANTGIVLDVVEYYNKLLKGDCDYDSELTRIFEMNNFINLGSDGIDML